MTPDHGPVDKILEALQERAKELQCLYQVDERLSSPGATLDEILRGIVQVIPAGYQFPDVCRARITFQGAVFCDPGFEESPWVMAADLVVQGKAVGRIEVFYTRSMPRADEGPFLKEERKLIDTIAERISHQVMQQKIRWVLDDWQAASREIASGRRQEWWVVIDFLRMTDRQLLIRLSRKLINHLCWNGIAEAQRLLQRYAPDQGTQEEVAMDENRPLERRTLQDLMRLTEETFRIAAAHMSEADILERLQKWIKDDKSSFLLQTFENPATTLAESVEAIQRFRHTGLDERELTRPLQTALHVSLIRRFFSDELDVINAAKNYVQVSDFYEVAQHLISASQGHGKLGGKSTGLFVAAQIVRKSPEYAHALSGIRVPKTWYVSSDGLLDFIQFNHLEDVYNRKYLEPDQVRREYPHIIQVFKNSHFSPEIVKGLSVALDDLGEKPLIVRSSSLLEDRMGAAFSGKYKSLFLANQGPKKERLAALTDAIAEVYASIFGPDPLEYRAERGMLDLHEEMAVMIQEVVGTKVGDCFFPAFAGVAFSNNEFRWSPRIQRQDGLLRIVPGLGTRAVDRLGDDYPVLIAPGQPGLRANVSPDEIVRYAPRMMDVINLRTREFESVEVRRMIQEAGGSFPLLTDIVSVVDDGVIRRPMGFEIDPDRQTLVVTFDGLTTRTPFVARMHSLLRVLREKLGVPVDIEFACDGHDLYLLQCRPQSNAADTAPAVIPVDPPRERVIFTANRYVSNGRVPDVTHVVYVDPRRYAALSTLDELRDVGRAVGRLNKLLPKRQFVLIGPGRWGSRGDIRLGVSVTYSDINNTAMLIEVARKEGNYVPDLSFGTHFFQDLVEASIRYLPLFPDDAAVQFNEGFLRGAHSILAELLPEFSPLDEVIRVIDVPKSTDGMVLKVLLNADREQAIGLLGAPAGVADTPSTALQESPRSQEVHWRWRLRMAERIASQLDGERFGVRALYVFGSTKNATAGAASDIDLLVHFVGSERQKAELDLWFEGWSLCLCEINFLRTGCKNGGTLDVHYVGDEEIARQSSYAAKIGAVTDPARLLTLGRAAPAR